MISCRGCIQLSIFSLKYRYDYLTISQQSVMSEIETLKSMKINEKMHGVKMNLGEFLKQVLEGGFFSYSGSLTTPGLLMINKFKNIIFLIS